MVLYGVYILADCLVCGRLPEPCDHESLLIVVRVVGIYLLPSDIPAKVTGLGCKILECLLYIGHIGNVLYLSDEPFGIPSGIVIEILQLLFQLIQLVVEIVELFIHYCHGIGIVHSLVEKNLQRCQQDPGAGYQF